MEQARVLMTALAYPNVDQFDPHALPTLQSLVVWLENVKIRHYVPEHRKALVDRHSDAWPAVFRKYLEDLGAPSADYEADPVSVVSWLLRLAVSYEYSDNADAMNAQADWHSPLGSKGSARSCVAIHDVGSAHVQDQLHALLDELHVRQPPPQLAAQAQAAEDEVVRTLLPAVVASTSGRDGVSGEELLACLPAGLEFDDPKLHRAATVLRALFIRDLRILQTQVDELLVAVQEHTANPRTDASLGKVGR